MNECCWLTDGMNGWKWAVEESSDNAGPKSLLFSLSDTISHFHNGHLSSGFIINTTTSSYAALSTPYFKWASGLSFLGWFACAHVDPGVSQQVIATFTLLWVGHLCDGDSAQHSKDRGKVVRFWTLITEYRDLGQLRLKSKALNYAFWWNSVWSLG